MIDFWRLKLGVILTAKTTHNQSAHNKSQKLYQNSYFAKPFYGVSKLWMSAKYMSNIKSIGALARLYCFVEICWNLHPFPELKNVFFANFRTFLKFSKCKALGDFLISFLERVPLKGCLGGISQNWNFWNWFEIRDIFRHWLLNEPAFNYYLFYD